MGATAKRGAGSLRAGLMYGAILVLGLVLILGIGVLAGCGGSDSDRIPTRAEFRHTLLSSAAVEGGRAAAAADLATVAGCPAPVLLDSSGTVRDLGWFVDRFGAAVAWTCAEPHPDADHVFRLVELREQCGPAVLIVRVLSGDGAPLAGLAVVRGWPGAPALPEYDPPASRYTIPEQPGEIARGVVGWTSGSGDVGFGLGPGDYYDPATGSGVSWAYIADYDGPSDLIQGLGMLSGTEHCTLYPTFERIPKDEIEPPTPTPGPTGEPVPAPAGLIQIEELWIRIATPAPSAEPVP